MNISRRSLICGQLHIAQPREVVMTRRSNNLRRKVTSSLIQNLPRLYIICNTAYTPITL
jgi:hypothetical protein